VREKKVTCNDAATGGATDCLQLLVEKKPACVLIEELTTQVQMLVRQLAEVTAKLAALQQAMLPAEAVMPAKATKECEQAQIKEVEFQSVSQRKRKKKKAKKKHQPTIVQSKQPEESAQGQVNEPLSPICCSTCGDQEEDFVLTEDEIYVCQCSLAAT
jgi:uncharacterized membrane protein